MQISHARFRAIADATAFRTIERRLMRRTQSLVKSHLEDAKRQRFLDGLQSREETLFLATFVLSSNTGKKEEADEDNFIPEKGCDERADFPKEKPLHLTARHFRWLQGNMHMEAKWMDAYISLSESSYIHETKLALIQLTNEFIYANQV